MGTICIDIQDRNYGNGIERPKLDFGTGGAKQVPTRSRCTQSRGVTGPRGLYLSSLKAPAPKIEGRLRGHVFCCHRAEAAAVEQERRALLCGAHVQDPRRDDEVVSAVVLRLELAVEPS